MTTSFLDHIKEIEDYRIIGMTTYPLDEVLLTVLTGLLCRAEDFDEIEMLCTDQLEWLQRFLPFNAGVAPPQTLRRVLQALCPRTLESAFASWVASLQETITGVVAIDGKTLCGSKQDANGAALHIVSAYAHKAGLVLAQRGVESKSNEITAIPDVLNLLEIEGAIVTIDAIGTQKSIAEQIVTRKADYLLALKGNQKTLYDDVAEFFADPELVDACLGFEDTSFGHGRIEERSCRVASAGDWLTERHPGWRNLSAIAEVTVRRTDKKTTRTSVQKRFYISSLHPDPAVVLAASRSHGSVENNVHWLLDVSLREDDSRTRKDHSARNLAMMRRAVLNMARREPSKMSLKRKRLKAALSKKFRENLLAC